ncbi:hypothetical protein J2W55_000958 [Mucilaginibacter pocheonensis]|uniref:Uncharacterized protein n=1 Tax=Mucilaginibacter pocheonensis TaxID=398050 RepID=A0ABU1T8I3_9SPHI|nr:hypothetical protein [Mucilaginibacter pocheonensis]
MITFIVVILVALIYEDHNLDILNKFSKRKRLQFVE